MDTQILRSYLVSLGWKVDQVQLQQFEGTLSRVQTDVERHVANITPTMVKAAGTIAAAYAGIGAAVVGLADNVSQAELQYQLFSMKMFVSNEMGKKLKITLDALGASMQDVFWSKELSGRYLQLMEDQTRMQQSLGENYPVMMKQLRDVRFEFVRLEVELKYLAMALVQAIVKSFGTDVDGLLKRLRDFNDWLISHLNETADKLTTVLIPVLNNTRVILEDIGRGLRRMAEAFTNLMGVLSGDKSLQGTDLTFDKISRAIQYANVYLGTFVHLIATAGTLLWDLLNASTYAQSLHFDKAKDWMKNFVSDWKASMQGFTDIAAGMPGPVAGAKSTDATSAADRARELAKQVGAQLGISADWIFRQWEHETGGFSSRVFRQYHNLAGIRLNGQYQNFGSLEESAARYAEIMKLPRYSGARGARTMDDFVAGLKRGGYFEDSYGNYLRGMQRFSPTMIDNSVTVGDVHVNAPNGDPEQVYHATMRAIDDKLGKGNQRLIAEYSGAYSH